jgi:hypothetical protein
LIEQIRAREQGDSATAWTGARAAVHAALAARSSRLAVYDLRESLERATQPLPVEMLTALGAIGDRSCLEAIAAAYSRVSDQWWRRHLVEAFHVIVAREGITRRTGPVAKIHKRHPEALDRLWPAAPKRR